MAKKRKIKKAEIVAPSTMEGTPSLHLDLESDELDILKNKKIGSELVLVIKGRLVSYSHRVSAGSDETTGSVSLEDYDVEIGDNSAWDKLIDDADDMDDGDG